MQSLAAAEVFEFPKSVYYSPKWKHWQQEALLPMFLEGKIFLRFESKNKATDYSILRQWSTPKTTPSDKPQSHRI